MYTTATFELGELQPDGTMAYPHIAESRLREWVLRQDGPLAPTSNGDGDVSMRFEYRPMAGSGREVRTCIVTFGYRLTTLAAKFAVSEALNGALNRAVDITVTHHRARLRIAA